MRATEVRQDITEEELRVAAKLEKNAGLCRRLLGIAHLLKGGGRPEAEKIACLTTNTFRKWIERFNAAGIEGLRAKRSSGRPPKLTAEISRELKEKVLEGPHSNEKLVRYRLVDIQIFLKEKYGIDMCLSGLWRQLQALQLTWKTGRQRHPKSDLNVQETFKKTSKIRL